MQKRLLGATRTVYTGKKGGYAVEIIVQCEFCQKDIRGPRECRGQVIQRFCSDLCRFRFHNHKRLELFRELVTLLKRGGFVADGRR